MDAKVKPFLTIRIHCGLWGAGVVGAVISYSAYKTGARLGGGRRGIDPVVGEIVHALLALGGSAHRDTVVAHIASGRAGRTTAATQELRAEIYSGFRRYIEMASARRPAPLLHLPLGPSSYRWSLTDAGRSLFAHPAPSRQQAFH